MFKHRSPVIFTIPTVVIFLVALVAQPASFTRLVAAQTEDEGGGHTKRAEKLSKSEMFNFELKQSVDKEEAEKSLSGADGAESLRLPGGLDHAAAGTGTRNAGHGTIRLRGVPAGSIVVYAYLYWGVIAGNSPPFPPTATANFEGHLVTGSLIGNSEQPCWVGDLNGEFLAYKATVTQFIPPVINGDYQVDGFASSITDGSEAWPVCSPNPPIPLAEGASLVIVYSHAQIPTAARVYINEGPHTFASQLDIPNPLSPVVPAHTSMKQTRIGADGDVGCGVFAQAPLNDEKTYLGTTVANLFQIRGDRDPAFPIVHPALHRDSDWNGYDGATQNMLWDTNTSGFAPSLNAIDPVPANSASYLIRYKSQGDCIVAVVHILSVR
jgi:hypothetical protein